MTTSNAELRLVDNPSDTDIHTGKIDPELIFMYGEGAPTSISVYLKATTHSLGGTPLEKMLKVKIEICDDIPIAPKSKFTIKRGQGDAID